jgi:lysozyme
MHPVLLAAVLARKFEGLYLRPYLCPAGVATIGFGSTRYENGARVTLSDPPITKERAEELLMHELRTVCLPAVMRYAPAANTPGRIAALVDFVFNLGSGRLQTSTLRKRVAEGDWDSAKAELMKWTRGGGKVLLGLVKRRAAEVALL